MKRFPLLVFLALVASCGSGGGGTKKNESQVSNSISAQERVLANRFQEKLIWERKELLLAALEVFGKDLEQGLSRMDRTFIVSCASRYCRIAPKNTN